MAFIAGIIILFFMAIILPLVCLAQIRELREQVQSLKNSLSQVLILLEKQGIKLQGASAHREESVTPAQSPSKSAAKEIEVPKKSAQIIRTPPAFEKKPAKEKSAINYEQQFGARLPVWIGGIALALAGFFMVKYSIETGLLSPMVRIVLGVIFGCGLLYGGIWIRSKPDFANGTSIAQALSGAGIADLYVCVFAATNLYDLIPAPIGFAGMAVVTATAVTLSLRHGMPIALLGLIGGFLTPAMISSNNPQAPVLFIYLYFVVAGLMVVIRKHNWWGLSLLNALGAFLWVLIWLLSSSYTPGDTIWLGLFLIAVSATMIASSNRQYEKDNQNLQEPITFASALNYLTLSGALLLTGVVASWGGFGLTEWGLFGLLSLGGIGLAHFNQRLYGLVPWLSMAVNAIMLFAWHTTDTNALALTLTLFGVLYIVSGYLLQSRSERPLIWAGLTAAASLGYYLLGYYELRHTELASGIPMLWGILALFFAALGTYALQNIMTQVAENHPQKQHLMTIYAGTASAFLAIALTIELNREFLSVAFAAQMLAMAWINTRVDIKSLRYMAGILAGVFGILLFPQILLLIQITAYSLTEAKLTLVTSIPIVNWPLFQLGLPALFFVASSYLLRQKQDDKLVQGMEISAIALIAIMGYYLTRQAFHLDENVLFIQATFVEAAVITNILFVYGLGCLWVGKKFSREAISFAGLTLVGIAIFRICYFDLLLSNPLWSKQAVGAIPLFNGLLLIYGLPILWTWKAIVEVQHIGKAEWSKYGYGFMLALAFVLISLNVRQIFHGTYLNVGPDSNAEIYTYSVAWLLFGIALLFLGTYRKDKLIRRASLAVMVLTVGKVFLFDARELEGLFRVFSFFGLGLSLMGLSWFYTRFVFSKSDTKKEL